MQQFKHDYQCFQAYTRSPDSAIAELEFDGDSTLNFRLVLPSLDKIKLSLIVPQDYPKGEYMLVVPTDGLRFSAGNEVKTLSRGTVSEVFAGIQEEYWKPAVALKAAALARSLLRSSGRHGLMRSGLKASRGLAMSSESQQEEAFDDGDDFFEGGGPPKESAALTVVVDDVGADEAEQLHEQLVDDVAEAKKALGSVGMYEDSVALQYIVRIGVKLPAFLDEWTAAAWGVTKDIPIVVELSFTRRYLRDKKLVLSVSQSGSKLDERVLDKAHDFGLRWYLTNRLQDVLRRNWIKYYRSDTSKKEQNEAVAIVPITTRPSKKDALGEALGQVMTKGFGKAVAEIALDENKGSPEAALTWLQVPANLQSAEARAEGLKAHEASMAAEPLYSGMAGMSPAEIEACENFFAGNFFVKVAQYVELRLRTCPSSCIICDAPLPFVGLKPSVCPKPLCNHSFEAYGLGFSLIGELRHNTAVTDLLITMTVACCKNKRANGADVFTPYPEAISVERKNNVGQVVQTLSFMEGKKKRTDIVDQTCNKIPPVDKMKDLADEKALKLFLDNLDPLCFPLLRWIILSNRSHLTPIPKNKHIKEMITEHQYILISDHPEKNARWKALKAEQAKKTGGRGSFYAFHGSAIGNWHCILRMGLKNYSNTDKMSAGAACGPGIYFAAHAATSAGYMVAGNCWPNSQMGQGPLSCIAVCEIVDRRKEPGRGVNVHNQVYVVTDETLVLTRYFFVYTKGNALGGKQIVAENLPLKELEEIYH